MTDSGGDRPRSRFSTPAKPRSQTPLRRHADTRLTTEQVVVAMLAQVGELRPARLLLAECRECILADPIISSADLPARSLATRDGFAIRAADVAEASASLPVRLRVIGESVPGDPAPNALPAHTAIRVMTGAPLPLGADAVVRLEDSRFQQSTLGQNDVDFLTPAARGQFIGQVGSEFAAGAAALPARLALGPAELAALASLGLTHVLVVPKPRISIVVSGTELRRMVGESDPAKLHASNGVLVTAMVQACGGIVESARIVSDDRSELAQALENALSADLILTTGGTGRGSRDLMDDVLRCQEVASMRNVKVKGSRQPTFRLLRDHSGGRVIPHLALPGRSAAAIVAFSLFAYPLIRRLSGRPARKTQVRRARLVVVPESVHKSQRFFPVRLRRGKSGWEAVPTGDASLYGLAAAIAADGFVLLGQTHDEPVSGQRVSVLLLPWREALGARDD